MVVFPISSQILPSILPTARPFLDNSFFGIPSTPGDVPYFSLLIARIFHVHGTHPYENIVWNCMVYHGMPWYSVVLYGIQCLPVSKHHGILSWFPCFKAPWYTTVSMVYRGILPWFIHVHFLMCVIIVAVAQINIYPHRRVRICPSRVRICASVVSPFT